MGMLPGAFIFDMDGLMFDTERLGQKAWHEVGGRLGIEIGEDILSQIRGGTAAANCEVFRRAFGPTFDYAAAKALRNELAEKDIQKHGLPVKPGLGALLRTLKAHNIPAAVASSSPRATVQRYLKMAGLAEYYRAIVGAEDSTRSKPAPDCFLLAAQRLGTAAERCLVLEDSANGLLAAKAAGMQAICIPDISLPHEEALQYAAAVLPTLADVWPWLHRA